MVVPTMKVPLTAMQLGAMLDREGAEGNQYGQKVFSIVGASPVKDADEPPSIGLPASPTPM